MQFELFNNMHALKDGSNMLDQSKSMNKFTFGTKIGRMHAFLSLS